MCVRSFLRERERLELEFGFLAAGCFFAHPVVAARRLRELRPHRNPPIRSTGRISISLGPGIGFGQRFTHSTASAIFLTSQIQKPATSSPVRSKGPSMMVRLRPVESHALSLRRRLQSFAGLHDAGLDQLFVVLAHGFEKFSRGHDPRFAVLRRLHQNHNAHRCLLLIHQPVIEAAMASCSYDERAVGGIRHLAEIFCVRMEAQNA